MPSATVFSIELPYLGSFELGRSPLHLSSFQKPLRELYVLYRQEKLHDERRIIISDSDLLIFKHDEATKGKCALIYTDFESIVDVQLLKLCFAFGHTDLSQQKTMQTAFLPIGYEHQHRFHSLYSKINKVQYNVLTRRKSPHPPLLLFLIRKPDVGNSCSLLDCHVFGMPRESAAFDLCSMIRKLITKRTMSPVLSNKATLLQTNNNKETVKNDSRIKYLKRNRPMSTMEHQNIHNQNNDLTSNVNSNDVVHLRTNTHRNPFSSCPLVINSTQHPPQYHDTSKVLRMSSDIHRTSSPCSTLRQRHFIKASSQIQDESDEIVNDLLNIVAIEQSKSQASVKRQASFDQNSNSDESTMNKKRYMHTKKRLAKPIPTINNLSNQPKRNSMIDGQLFRPQFLLSQYGDIGNYVPKFLRDHVTTRSSDSNENIFFRSTNGQLLNGFLQLDFVPPKAVYENVNSNNHYQSTPSLNQDENIYSLVQQIRNNQAKSCMNIHQINTHVSNRTFNTKANLNDNFHYQSSPCILKSKEDVINGIKALPFQMNSNVYPTPCKVNVLPTSSKPKRVASFSIGEAKLPVDYRQYLRHTDQGAYLYAEEQRQLAEREKSLEHSLGYFP